MQDPQKRQSCPLSVWVSIEDLPCRAGLSRGQKDMGKNALCRQANWKREKPEKRLSREEHAAFPFPPSHQADNAPLLPWKWVKEAEPEFLNKSPQRKFRGLWNRRRENLLLYCHWTLSDRLTSSWNLAFPPVMKGGNKPDLHEPFMWLCRQEMSQMRPYHVITTQGDRIPLVCTSTLKLRKAGHAYRPCYLVSTKKYICYITNLDLFQYFDNGIVI